LTTLLLFCVTNILDPAVLAECGQTDGKVETRNLMPYYKPKSVFGIVVVFVVVV